MFFSKAYKNERKLSLPSTVYSSLEKYFFKELFNLDQEFLIHQSQQSHPSFVIHPEEYFCPCAL